MKDPPFLATGHHPPHPRVDANLSVSVVSSTLSELVKPANAPTMLALPKALLPINTINTIHADLAMLWIPPAPSLH